ncbi:hypothetical protein HAT2_00019 [Candidatus Similichlamydia laticola]|uniref:TsaE protein, required for threonylcarbamoyladenosine t(6)A37 formation in tRNA n=1 Tax=Candidatus Similichlamydia laticola TaxID=2170265 RepID=A0A369KG31_9BACT|nr:hypothetical protein HAT2_00019 [Candidatus Similichlamydia laticola]
MLNLHETSRGTLFHFDLFRLQKRQERTDSLEEFLFSPGLKCVEWPTTDLLQQLKQEATVLHWSVVNASVRSLRIDTAQICTT